MQLYVTLIRFPYLFKSLYYNNAFPGLIEIPTWMAKAKETLLLPKDDQTIQAKNYRPISLQNIISKLYTDCIDQFLQKHCKRYNIITTEQAGCKNEAWRCFEQHFL